MDPILRAIIALILGYLLGSILPAYFLAKARGFDIRERGSGNPGITNVADTMGTPRAMIVAIYDLGKAPLAILLARELGNPVLISYLAGFAAFLGHLAPFYLRFRGGEGLATLVSIGFFALGELTSQDSRFAYILAPTLVAMALVFFLLLKRRPAKLMVFILVPILINGAILFFGITPHTTVFLLVGLAIIGHRLYKLLRSAMLEMPKEDQKLLWRKWLRPLAIVFPLGVLFFKTYTLIVLAVVFAFFITIEVIRFLKKYNRFPVPYRKTEESRLSSMVIFLFSTLLVLLFFPTNIATLAIMFVVFGDLLAWCVGITVGGAGFLGKTWSGTAACLATCLTVAVIYSAMDMVLLPIGILGALTATAVEVAPLHEDNFVMPVASAIIMTIF